MTYRPGARSVSSTEIVGFNNVMANLRKAILQIEGGTARGVVLAVAHVRRQMETTPPLTPVDKGNLRASWFVTVTRLKNVEMPILQNEKGKDIREGMFVGKLSKRMRSEHGSTKAEASGLVNSMQRKIQSIFGFTAFYAAAIHEKLAANFQRPGAGPKWFEQALNSNTDVILKIIKDNAYIRK